MIKEDFVSVLALSDLHWNYPYITDLPECDIFLYCGDWSGAGKMSETFGFLTWLSYVKAKHKIIIPGNHDCATYNAQGLIKDECKKLGISMLIDEGITCCHIPIYGTPWSPRFGDWVYMRPDDALYDYFKNIPFGTKILLTHTPPYGILDMAGVEHIGSKSLLKVIKRKYIPFHFFGHNHTFGKFELRNNSNLRRFYNVSVCDNDYNITNIFKPILLSVQYDDETGECKSVKLIEDKKKRGII